MSTTLSHPTNQYFLDWSTAILFLMSLAGLATADPILGRDVIKFSQLPMISTPLVGDAGFLQSYHGHDELSTAWSSFNGGTPGVPLQFDGYDGRIMTDDFADPLSSPVVHVKWWGSYLNGPLTGVQKFLISFGQGYNRGELRPDLSQVVVKGPISKGSGTFTETQISSTSVDGPIYEYNAELYLGKEFAQQPDRLHSISIAALVDIGPTQNPLTDPTVVRWGWHTRDYTQHNPYASSVNQSVSDSVVGVLAPSTNIWHFGDAALPGDVSVRRGPMGNFIMPMVRAGEIGNQPFNANNYETASDGPLAITQYPSDLAFTLYTIPEPASWALALTMTVALVVGRRR